MRRSFTVTGPVEQGQPRPMANRAVTMSPWIPSISLVEKGLNRMELDECAVSIDDVSERSAPASVEKVEDIPETFQMDPQEEEEVYQVESDSSEQLIKDSEKELQFDGETSCREEVWESHTAETSLDEPHSSEWVHKPLKDLIFKTNKDFYDIDSNKVRYKVGLSRRAAIIPSLHRKKE